MNHKQFKEHAGMFSKEQVLVARFPSPRTSKLIWAVVVVGEPLLTMRRTIRSFRTLERAFEYLHETGVKAFIVSAEIAPIDEDTIVRRRARIPPTQHRLDIEESDHL